MPLMKSGCLGCLLLLVILVVVLVGGGAALFFAGSVFETPRIPQVAYSPADGYRAQQKLFALTREEVGRPGPVVITEREVNAFLGRHLEESAGLPLSPLVVKLLPGVAQVYGQTSFGALLKGFPFSLLPDYLPEGTLDRRVWVSASVTLEMTRPRARGEPRSARLRVTEFGLGTQDLGPWILSLLLGRTERTLSELRLPRSVKTLAIEAGRVVITTGG